MKKFLFAIFTSFICLSLFAQETTEVNRLIIVDKSYNVKGFILDKVDYIEFETIEGEVAANVVIKDVKLDTITIDVTRTAECESFKIACFPSVRISSYDDNALISLIDNDSPDVYYTDFTDGKLTGVDLEPNTDYTILTVGIDVYGVMCDVRKAEFTTPSLPLVGDPQVAVEEVDIQHFEFTLKFTPNADVSKYSVVAGEKGSLEQQFEMFAPMFGFANIGQMVEMWGVGYTEEESFTWTDMSPGTEYEVFIQARDTEGTMAPHQVYTLTTTILGGDGIAEVEITLGEYKLADWNGEMLPSQFITFTPNDQANSYRFEVYTAETYDADAEGCKEYLCSEPPMPMVGWFQYETLTTDFQINPNTECVAIAAAKNANGEWGPVNELRFTTPAEAAEDMMPSTSISKRKVTVDRVHKAGTLPTLPSRNEVKLIGE